MKKLQKKKKTCMYTQTEEILPSSVSAIKVHSDEKINPAAAKAAPFWHPCL